jgi:hypothetical protein
VTTTAKQSTDKTRRLSLAALCMGIIAIALGYASAFFPDGPPVWAPWMLALGIPATLGGVMALGATRGTQGLGRLKIPFVFVVVVLAAGFCAALALPSTESATATLWLGLPLRAALVIYGIGLLPIAVLPAAYALTFDSQTLRAEDVERVRALAREIERERALEIEHPRQAER